jgi:uncharacterized membrane-anchored protein YitT (DUF2179 family)
LKRLFHITLLIFSAFLISCGFNLFLIPHKLLSGGVSGISMVLGYFTSADVVVYYFCLNLPLLILGWFFVGRRFILYSVVSVIATTVFMKTVPIVLVATDPLLSSVYAGVLIGAGAGISLKIGGSSGGIDIVGAMISRYKDLSVGTVVTYLNTFIVLGYGYILNDWNIGLASAVSIYISGRVVNFIYIENEKVTVNIITDKAEEISAELFKLHKRGITALTSEGVYSAKQKKMLMTVITRYELVEVKEAIRRIDDQAFVNITQTIEVMGNFRKQGK